MIKVVVLGAGRIGGTIARDLANDPGFRMTVADASVEALRSLEGIPALATVRTDLSDATSLGALARDHDLVVGALPSHLGYQALRTVIEAGRDLVDISFFAEDPFTLDAPARERGVRALVDCGMAPGLSNVILGRDLVALEEGTRYECLVGGLPADRPQPFAYRAPFSPTDVIEEYIRPARIRRNGRVVTLPALSEVEPVEFPVVGRLEAFLTDGLRTLLHTTNIPDMVEKTVRYPGHAEQMRTLRDAGYFDRDPVEISGTHVRPFDLTTKLFDRHWRYREGEEDLTVMRLTVERRRQGQGMRRRHHLIDRYDRTTGTFSMARTTAFTCTACVRLLANGIYRRPGVSAPENVGAEPGCLDFVLRELESRGVKLQTEDQFF